MTTISEIKLWHTLTFHDAEAMMRWLGRVGFVEHATYRDETDPAVVVHAEWVWPDAAAGLMFGSVREGGAHDNAGHAAAYLVVAHPDDVFERAVAAGADVTSPMADQDYGGRSGSLRDPEGNFWSFGDYQPG